MADVRREMLLIEPLAKESLAGFVLMKLRGRWAIPEECELVLLQGYCAALIERGFGVVMHRATAAAIRATIFLNAKSQFIVKVRAAKKQGRTTVDTPFDPKGGCILHQRRPEPLRRMPPPMHLAHAHPHTNTPIAAHMSDLGTLLTLYPDPEDDGDPDGVDNAIYTMGYTLIPPNVMKHFADFPPWDAFDCAHKRGAAQGIIASRCTKNGNNRVQFLSFSDLIGPESSLTCDAVMGAEAGCLERSPSAINGKSP